MAPLCLLLLARFGSANKQELMFLVAGLMALAQIDDLKYVREVIEKMSKISLGGLWQARAQLWATLGITLINAALLSFPQLAQPKARKQSPMAESTGRELTCHLSPDSPAQ